MRVRMNSLGPQSESEIMLRALAALERAGIEQQPREHVAEIIVYACRGLTGAESCFLEIFNEKDERFVVANGYTEPVPPPRPDDVRSRILSGEAVVSWGKCDSPWAPMFE